MTSRWAGWADCAGCDRERRVIRGRVMTAHNRYDEAAQAMVPCEGSGLPPAPERAEGDAA